jgi:hypothetical protein
MIENSAETISGILSNVHGTREAKLGLQIKGNELEEGWCGD